MYLEYLLLKLKCQGCTLRNLVDTIEAFAKKVHTFYKYMV